MSWGKKCWSSLLSVSNSFWAFPVEMSLLGWLTYIGVLGNLFFGFFILFSKFWNSFFAHVSLKLGNILISLVVRRLLSLYVLVHLGGPNEIRQKLPGGSTVVQGIKWCLWNAEMQVQPLAQHSGLRIMCCHSCSRLQLHLRFDPWPGNSLCHEATKKEKKKKRKRNCLEITLKIVNYFWWLNLKEQCPVI